MTNKVYIPLAHDNSNWNNNELRYCLRSLEGFDITIIGDKLPEFLDIDFIQADRWFPLRKRGASMSYENFFDTLNKLKILSQKEGSFIYIFDDTLLLRPVGDYFEKNKVLCKYKDFNFRGRWGNTILETVKLTKLGNECKIYDHHLPLLFECENLRKMFEKYPFENLKVPYAPISLYYWMFPGEETPIDSYGCFNEVKDCTWLNYSDSGLKNLKEWIVNRFPNPSKYENI